MPIGGVFLLQLFLAIFVVYYAWVKSKWPTWVKVVTTVTVSIFMLPIVIGVLNPPENSTKAPKTVKVVQQPEQKPPEAKPNTEKLNATVTRNNVAIKVTNNEDIDWVGCEVSINNKYGQVVPNIPKKDSVVLMYTDFTSAQAERFNYYQTAPQNVTIKGCQGENSYRLGYFEW